MLTTQTCGCQTLPAETVQRCLGLKACFRYSTSGCVPSSMLCTMAHRLCVRCVLRVLNSAVWHAEAEAARLQRDLELLRQQLQSSKESEAADQAQQHRLECLQLTHAQELNSANAELERLQLAHGLALDLMRSELAEMASQHAAASTQLQEVQQQHEAAMSEAQVGAESATSLVASETEVSRLQASRQELSQQLTKAQAQLSESQQQLELAQAELGRAVEDKSQLSASVERLETDVANAQAAKYDLVR